MNLLVTQVWKVHPCGNKELSAAGYIVSCVNQKKTLWILVQSPNLFFFSLEFWRTDLGKWLRQASSSWSSFFSLLNFRVIGMGHPSHFPLVILSTLPSALCIVNCTLTIQTSYILFFHPAFDSLPVFLSKLNLFYSHHLCLFIYWKTLFLTSYT